MSHKNIVEALHLICKLNKFQHVIDTMKKEIFQEIFSGVNSNNPYFGDVDVFVTPNLFLPSKDGEYIRRNETVASYRYAYLDFDIKGINEDNYRKYVPNYLINPTYQVFSGGGFHAYWKIKDLNKENWYKIQNGLLKIHSAADQCVKDPARLLRLPATINSKHGNMVTI